MNTFAKVVSVLLWVTVLWRSTKDWKKGHSRALWWSFFGLAVMMTLRLPIGREFDELTGVTDFSYLLKHLSGGVLGSAALLAFLRNVSGSPKGSRSLRVLRVAVPIVTATSMSVLFLARLQPYETAVLYKDFTSRLALLLYTAIFLSFLTSSLVSGVRVCWRWGRESGNGSLGWGLRLIGAGLSAGVLYSIARIAALASRLRDQGILAGDLDDQVASYLLLTALLLVVVGSTLPALGKLRAWRSERRELLRLRRLWQDLTEAVPSVRLDPPRSSLAEHLDVRHVQGRLYRRTMEIRDAALALNDHASPSVRASADEHVRATGLIGTQAETTAEACRLAFARRARLRGEPAAPQHHQPSGGGRDLRSEIRALAQLSEAFYSDVTDTFVQATELSSPNSSLETQS